LEVQLDQHDGDSAARLRKYQYALAALSRASSEALPPDRLLHHAASQIALVTHIDHVKIMRYRPELSDLLIVAGVGWRAGVVGVVSLGTDHASPPGRAMQTGRPVVIPDLPNAPDFRLSDLLRSHGIVSALNVPIMVSGRTWGVLEIDSQQPRAFNDDDVVFLTIAANTLGVAFLRHETEEKARDAGSEHGRALERAAVMLQEMQHRTKNNLQTIVAFLSLQRRRTDDADTKAKLGSVMDRVYAIALAHDQLLPQQQGGDVDFASYLRSLCANIDPHRENIRIDVNVVQGLVLSLDRAVQAGLIVNELVTNCMKYAFDESGGVVQVRFWIEADRGEACLSVEDNGRGFTNPREGGMGLTLVSAFTEQLGGRVAREPIEKGTRTCVRFPLPI
jgi:two-component sensor histidine kinase